jgi:DNA-binding response OmpR family regulator
MGPFQRSGSSSGGPRIDHRLVVVADSSEFVHTLAATALQLVGYEPLGATNAEEALDHVRRRYPGTVLVEDELMQPAGWILLWTIASEPALMGTRIILMTDDPADREVALARGASEHLAKPFGPHELLAAVRGDAEQEAPARAA